LEAPVSDPAGIVLAREDGVVVVPNGMPVVHGLVEAVEMLFASLGIPARDERQERTEEER
jgi:hypothetical protein